MKDVAEPTVSPFKMVDDYGMNLVVHPLRNLPAVLVAVVSVEKVSQQYIKPLHDGSATDGLLVNHCCQAIMASREGLIGQDLTTVATRLPEMPSRRFKAGDRKASRFCSRQSQ